jgi:hypothetical protein
MHQRTLYSYVVDHDLGYAPNPIGGLCTLAYCKFSQSNKRNVVELAEEDDWIVGTGGKSHESAGHGKLIYAMRVTRKIPLAQYNSSPRYAGRGDRFPEDRHTHGRFALISDDFWYFGRNAVDVSLIPTRHLDHRFEKRGPAYRADFSELFIADFEQWIRATYPPGIHGEPCGPRPPHWNTKRVVLCRPRRCA